MIMCKVDSCRNIATSKKSALCQKHYKRMKKHGTTSATRRCRDQIDSRFWLYVDKKKDDECWPWIGSTGPNGYGRTSYLGKKDAIASRVSYEITHGKIPDGKIVMHTCDNRKCVNPSHLMVGSYLDNTRDMINKGRAIHNPMVGSKHPRSKVTEEDVLEIRENKEGNGAIAKRYNVSVSAIAHIRKMITWRHV